MDILYDLEQRMKRPTPHMEKQHEMEDEESKWNKMKDNTKNILGCVGVVLPSIVLFSTPWWLQEVLGKDSFDNLILIIFAIFAVLTLAVLFYVVWRLVNKNIEASKSKAKIIITSIVIYVLVVVSLAGIIYICGVIAPTEGVNDGHLHRI